MSTDAWDWYSSDQWATRDDAHHYVPTPTSTADGSPLTGDLADPTVRRLLHQLDPGRWDCDTQWCDGCTAPACVSRVGGHGDTQNGAIGPQQSPGPAQARGNQ